MASHLALLLAALTTLLLAATCIDFVVGFRRVRRLEDIAPDREAWPLVSIVVAARNEGRHIEAAATSLLALDYPALDIVIVDDRSTDDTGAILERLAQTQHRLKVKRVTSLPSGWLGKNYALHVGAKESTGSLLLFTDADVVFEPSTLRRAVTLFERDALDHLTAIPYAKVPGLALGAFVAAFGVFFSVYARPWKVRDPRSRAHVGIGAFNLLRADVYQSIGTHQAIAMRPDDDIKLGKLVKKHGFRQDVVVARRMLVVEWYASLGELVDGLMKNSFAGVNYSLLAVAGSTLALVLTNVWPFVAIVATEGIVRVLNVVSAVFLVVIFLTTARRVGSPAAFVFGYPFAALLFAYILWRSALTTIARGGIVWRGTTYSLSELRANRV